MSIVDSLIGQLQRLRVGRREAIQQRDLARDIAVAFEQRIEAALALCAEAESNATLEYVYVSIESIRNALAPEVDDE